ncbi:KilA-N domain protein [Hoylesella buccalis ATCC 35310]|uniref:KilA-N domain protein n=2 Tax=Hoylesella buccalis TaxID=28127 RepID=D1W5N2_9BACT|nr:KilA-N domain protein [Hoylesella buccalis ATCC 35310]
MVNATEMAKSFGKTTKDWLRTNASSEFINSLSVVRQICPSQLVVVKKGNSNEFEQGTWMHEDVALEFARWLSPAFAIWCNDRIKELLKYGMTATQPTLDEMLNNPDLVIRMATQLKQERAEKTRLEAENAQANERISLQDTQLKQQAPKVKSYDEYISSDGTFTTTQIAKEYGWGAKTLNNKLKERGIQYKQNRQWLLTAKYDGKGYTRSIPCTFTYSDGTIGTQMQTVWTTKGREFIHSLFDAA